MPHDIELHTKAFLTLWVAAQPLVQGPNSKPKEAAKLWTHAHNGLGKCKLCLMALRTSLPWTCFYREAVFPWDRKCKCSMSFCSERTSPNFSLKTTKGTSARWSCSNLCGKASWLPIAVPPKSAVSDLLHPSHSTLSSFHCCMFHVFVL